MITKDLLLIDIGSSSIKSFIISSINNESKIIGVGKSITSGFNGEKVLNYDDFIKSIKKSISQAKRQSSIEVSNAILILPTFKNKNQLTSQLLNLNGSQVENNHIRKLENSIKTDLIGDFTLLHSFKSHFKIDENIITENPIGINCNNLTINAINTYCNSQDLEFYKNLFNKLGINITAFYDSSIIYYIFLKSLNLHKKNMVLIDLGYKMTNILIIKNEKITLLKRIPIGSNSITNDFVKILNVNKNFAETIKLSKVDLTNQYKKTIEIPVWEELGSNLKRKIEHDYLKSIISSRIDEIFNLLFDSIPNSKFFYSYLITGGGAMQTNLKHYIHKKFGVELELIEPNQVDGIPNVLNNASLMSLFSLNQIIKNGALDNQKISKINDSFSNKIWYKRFLGLL